MIKLQFTMLSVIFAPVLFVGKINFISSFSEAQKLAAQQDKLIFVDVMADWCGPCKVMIKDMESDAAIVDFFNTNFINLKDQ
ncbi:MAG: thioredoxin family protein [Saprospiraceae bacterium]|nr:thioredoxin family protein [Saprospiraceae bacterium]